MNHPDSYDVIVIGAGHAGCEAAAAAARAGARTLLLTQAVETIGQMSCNPAIGGIGKSHLVREIDALDGLMGKAADMAGIQLRVLNASKGPAVRATRAQADRALYRQAIRQLLDEVENLTIFQQTVVDLLVEKRGDRDSVTGVVTQMGLNFRAGAVVLTTGTFLGGRIHIGLENHPGGRAGDAPSNALAERLRALPFRVDRLKTGTPPRIDGRSVDYSVMETQPGDDPAPLVSFMHRLGAQVELGGEPGEKPGDEQGNRQSDGSSDSDDCRIPFVRPRQVPCYITQTNENTHEIILSALDRSPLYTGVIEGTGPRYCPSIEDKVVRFRDRVQHQIFVEPEGLTTSELYPNGISTSLPFDVQLELVRSIRGFEQAHITRPGYAIEYDFFDPRDLNYSLETKALDGLFFAGQINGTTVTRKRALRGCWQGLNAARKVAGQSSLVAEAGRSLSRRAGGRSDHARHQRALPDVHLPGGVPAAAAGRQRGSAADPGRPVPGSGRRADAGRHTAGRRQRHRQAQGSGRRKVHLNPGTASRCASWRRRPVRRSARRPRLPLSSAARA